MLRERVRRLMACGLRRMNLVGGCRERTASLRRGCLERQAVGGIALRRDGAGDDAPAVAQLKCPARLAVRARLAEVLESCLKCAKR